MGRVAIEGGRAYLPHTVNINKQNHSYFGCVCLSVCLCLIEWTSSRSSNRPAPLHYWGQASILELRTSLSVSLDTRSSRSSRSARDRSTILSHSGSIKAHYRLYRFGKHMPNHHHVDTNRAAAALLPMAKYLPRDRSSRHLFPRANELIALFGRSPYAERWQESIAAQRTEK